MQTLKELNAEKCDRIKKKKKKQHSEIENRISRHTFLIYVYDYYLQFTALQIQPQKDYTTTKNQQQQ